MGNWRTVTIVGTCPADELVALTEATCYDYMDPDAPNDRYGALCWSPRPGLMGLGKWPAERMDVSGNCAERDFSVGDIAKYVSYMAEAAPGLNLKVHCGGDYEDPKVIATISAENGVVRVGEPEVKTVRGASADEMKGRFLENLMGR